VLPPIYLIARVAAVGAGSLLAALAALIVQAVVVVLLLGLQLPVTGTTDDAAPAPMETSGMSEPFTEAQLATLLTPEGMADKILFDAHGSSLNYETVVCEPLGSTELGAQTTCLATSALARYELLIQVLPNGTGTPFAIVSVNPILE
jgi:hypothetical protein